MMIMLYTTIAATSHKEKYWVRNTTRKGTMHATIRQVMNGIQFFFVLNMFILEKASCQICLVVGTTNSPFSSLHL
jgi:hypothetical protein